MTATPTTPALSDEGLLPCPFPHKVVRGPFIERDTEDFWFVRVSCGDCGCAGPYVSFDVEPVQSDDDEAVRLWNDRATRPPVKGDSVELVERLSALVTEVEAWPLYMQEELRDTPVAKRLAAILEASGHAALSERVVVLEGVLRNARKIVASDADACRAFAAPSETSEPEEVLKLIDAALKGCGALGGGL